MDSTQVASNIRVMGRLQLLVEVLRVYRMLTKEDRDNTPDCPIFDMPQYVYHLGTRHGEHLQRIVSATPAG